MMAMVDCPSFESCSANLCPLDPNLKDRVWYLGESICTGRAGSGLRWLKKMRTVSKRKTKSYMDKPITYQMLYDNSRPMQLSDAQRLALKDRLAKARESVKTKASVVGSTAPNNSGEGSSKGALCDIM